MPKANSFRVTARLGLQTPSTARALRTATLPCQMSPPCAKYPATCCGWMQHSRMIQCGSFCFFWPRTPESYTTAPSDIALSSCKESIWACAQPGLWRYPSGSSWDKVASASSALLDCLVLDFNGELGLVGCTSANKAEFPRQPRHRDQWRQRHQAVARPRFLVVKHHFDWEASSPAIIMRSRHFAHDSPFNAVQAKLQPSLQLHSARWSKESDPLMGLRYHRWHHASAPTATLASLSEKRCSEWIQEPTRRGIGDLL